MFKITMMVMMNVRSKATFIHRDTTKSPDSVNTCINCSTKLRSINVKQSHYMPKVPQTVPGS